MSGPAAAITTAVLVSAVLHATWNALAHRIPDKPVAFAWLGVGYLVVCGPAALALPVPAARSWALLAASAALHVAYNLLMMQTYRLGEFNQVYPLARGTSPLVVAVAAAVLLHERLTVARTLGVLVVCAGLASLVLVGGLPRRTDLAPVVAAVATGLAIASYTVVDGVGVRRSGTAFGYTAWLMMLQSPVVPLYVLRRRGRRFVRTMQPHWRDGLAAGVLSLAAYALVLWAQVRGALAAVAALRESSVIAGAVIGSLWFHERFGRPRVVATVLVTAGIVVLNVV